MSSPRQDSFLGNYFEQALLELSIAQDLLTDAADFVRTQAPAPQDVGIGRAADDPHVILRFGQLRARLHAAEGLMARATRLADASGLPVHTATSPRSHASPPAIQPATAATLPGPTGTPTAWTIMATSRAAAPIAAPSAPAPTAASSPPALASVPSASPSPTPALIALLEVRAFASDLVAEISSQLVAWGGPLRAGQQRRDASGQLGPHTANHWNYHHAGNYYLKGVMPPTPEPRS